MSYFYVCIWSTTSGHDDSDTSAAIRLQNARLHAWEHTFVEEVMLEAWLLKNMGSVKEIPAGSRSVRFRDAKFFSLRDACTSSIPSCAALMRLCFYRIAFMTGLQR